MLATLSMSIFSVMFLVLMISSWLDTVTTPSLPTWMERGQVVRKRKKRERKRKRKRKRNK